MEFITKVERKSVPVVEFSDMQRIQNYQIALIDMIVYHQPRHKGGQLNMKIINQLHFEINSCEKWLKENFPQFMNDSNRKLTA